MLFIQIILGSFVGILSGFLAGLLGIGGGMIVVPFSFFLINHFYSESKYEHTMQLAAATALASMVLMTLSSMWFHQRKKGINWQLTRRMFLGLLIGSFLGVSFGSLIQSNHLKLLFGFFLLISGIQYLFENSSSKKEHLKVFKQPSSILINIGSLSISFISSLLGIGGGIFSVQYFSFINLDIRKSISTSSAITFFITFFAAIYYIVFGKYFIHSNQPFTYFYGPIYLPAFFSISFFSALSAPFGVMLIYKTNTRVVKKIFGVFLFIIGLYMITRSFF